MLLIIYSGGAGTHAIKSQGTSSVRKLAGDGDRECGPDGMLPRSGFYFYLASVAQGLKNPLFMRPGEALGGGNFQASKWKRYGVRRESANAPNEKVSPYFRNPRKSGETWSTRALNAGRPWVRH